MRYVVQTRAGQRYTQLFELAMQAGPFDEFWCAVAFGDNLMDKLNVPPSGDRGRLFYRGKTLLFSRRSDDAFDFAAGDQTQRRLWRETSRRCRTIHPLSRNREWGLF
jgi:hypothetical protein